MYLSSATPAPNADHLKGLTEPRPRKPAPSWGPAGAPPAAFSPTPAPNPHRTPAGAQKAKISAVWASTITPTALEWLWRPFLQGGALNLLTGDPGIGKSTVVCEIVAALSTGRPLPGEQSSPVRPPMRCWLLNSEDGAADTIIWRLRNQGAALDRILVTDQLTPLTAEVVADMKATILREKISLITLDPMQAWMGGEVDMHRANETRAWGGMLKGLCLDTGCTILMLRHRRKAAPGDNSLHSGLGSIDITGFARSEISVTQDAEGVCFVHRTKGNVGEKGGEVGYVIEGTGEPGNDHGRLRWLTEYNPVVRKPGKGRGPRGEPKVSMTPRRVPECQTFLIGALGQGPRPAKDVISAAQEHKFTAATLKAARKGLVDSKKDGHSGWVWSLITPQPGVSETLVCQ